MSQYLVAFDNRESWEKACALLKQNNIIFADWWISEDNGEVAGELGEKLEVPAIVQTAYDTFAVDLEELLKTHAGKWVIYCGNERLAFGDSPTDLLEEHCHIHGYPVDDLTVLQVDRNQPLAHVNW